MRLLKLSVLSFAYFCLLSCGSDGDHDINFSDDDTIRIATLSQIQQTWVGEYEGWDSLQNAKTKIRRKLILNVDSTYTNQIAAMVFIPNQKVEDFSPVEKESGKYRFDESNHTIYYNVAYDSIIDFEQQCFMGFTKKQYNRPNGLHYEREIYTENVKLTPGEKGSVIWETTDSALYSLDGKGRIINYFMNIEK